MPTCSTQKTIAEPSPIYNLILPIPDTDFRDFLDEVDELSRHVPGIIEAIVGACAQGESFKFACDAMDHITVAAVCGANEETLYVPQSH